MPQSWVHIRSISNWFQAFQFLELASVQGCCWDPENQDRPWLRPWPGV